ncbi:hypothetical protein EPUL_005090 [Erysiphe pulchra]|uniref:Uncharacterized protein n=1 Tax=Erysiphe pulchra TaxID=225359 RepID=A0A2S4PP36_9PEZI|nr:hypothetical protein EPUL_005090 [Erysiphe pulchra]
MAATWCRNYGGPHWFDSRKCLTRPTRHGAPTKEQLKVYFQAEAVIGNTGNMNTVSEESETTITSAPESQEAEEDIICTFNNAEHSEDAFNLRETRLDCSLIGIYIQVTVLNNQRG